MRRNDEIFYPLGFLCCCPDGPLSIEATAPVSGYTPGQTINVKVTVNNGSKQTLTNMEVQLNKVRDSFHSEIYNRKKLNFTHFNKNAAANHILRPWNA